MICTLVASAFVVFAARSQNLILNGSFEQPVIPTNIYQTATPTNWNWSDGTSGYIFNGNGGDPSTWPLPEHGQQFVDIGPISYGPLTQNFTITSPGVYVLSWFDDSGQSGGLTTAPYYVRVFTGAAQTVTSNTFDAYNATSAWVLRTNQLELIPGTYTLQFAGLNLYGGLNPLIDNVSLVQVQAENDDLLATIRFSAVDICWAGLTNQMYKVQYRTNLSDTNWIDLGSPVLGTGTNYVTDRIIGTPQRFYQVIRVP